MFTLSQEKLVSLGASITTAEIRRQPDLWIETFALYMEKSERIAAFLQKIVTKHNRVRVILQALERLLMSVIQSHLM